MKNKIIKLNAYQILEDGFVVMEYDLWLLKNSYLVSSNLHGPVMEFDTMEEAETFIESICKEYTHDS